MDGSGISAADEISLVASLTLSAALELVGMPASKATRSETVAFEEEPDMDAEGRTTVSEESSQENPFGVLTFLSWGGGGHPIIYNNKK